MKQIKKKITSIVFLVLFVISSVFAGPKTLSPVQEQNTDISDSEDDVYDEDEDLWDSYEDEDTDESYDDDEEDELLKRKRKARKIQTPKNPDALPEKSVNGTTSKERKPKPIKPDERAKPKQKEKKDNKLLEVVVAGGILLWLWDVLTD
ncbi:MAG: hypothetical protein IKX23_04355 [Treponema sp.]|nr:hypothetical protein [Treponema sp.]